VTAAVARRPRTGLKLNLYLLRAYEVHQIDNHVDDPDFTATMAMNSPLYREIEDTLSEQTQIKLDSESGATQTRRVAATAGDNMDVLGQMLEAMRPVPSTPFLHHPRELW